MALRKVWTVIELPGQDNRDSPLEAVLSRRNTGNRTEASQYYNSEADAISACERKAVENPLKPYAVMGIVAIRETAQPTVISKQFTDEGELIIV
jgi:hypothetical protein